MFRLHLRSIRRKLVSGYTVGLALMFSMAIASALGLVWYRDTVDSYDHLLNQAPDSDQLVRDVALVQIPLSPNRTPVNAVAVSRIQEELQARIDTAKASLGVVRRRVQTQSSRNERSVAEFKLQRVQQELDSIERELSGLEIGPEFQQMRSRMHAHLAQAMVNLELMPQFKSSLRRPLERDRERYRLLFKVIFGITVGALLLYALILYLGFRWVCNPIRMLARGARRIMNGDKEYRLPESGSQRDEMAELTVLFNRMADHFCKSEEELRREVEMHGRQIVRSERLAAVGFLATGVSHEINNPLSAISTAASSLEISLGSRADPNDPDGRIILKRLRMIREEARRCSEITAKLKEFARPGNATRENASLANVVSEVVTLVEHLSQFSDRTVHFDPSNSCRIEMNRAEMKQVVLNLVANALEATDSGGSVEIAIREGLDHVVLEVRDDGCGMCAEIREHLFEPFFTRRRTSDGTGLGLSISHRIVQEHHGSIDVQSDGPGQGTLFSVRLPRKQPSVRAA